jgi:uncharacterized membrane protein YphA (DoxX/SURF4 family)
MVVARAMMAYVFLLEGWRKIEDYADVSSYMQSGGVDGGFCRSSS